MISVHFKKLETMASFTNARLWLGLLAWQKGDKDGVYTLRGLPPGEYFVCASDDVDQGEWYDPELLQTLRARSSKIMLQEGDTKSLDLKLATSTPRP